MPKHQVEQPAKHAFSDVHEFREWMLAKREDEEQDAASDDLLSGLVTIAGVRVGHAGRHAGSRVYCDLGHAYGMYGQADVRYGYCNCCDQILECEHVERPWDCSWEEDVWFPIEWDRRSRDGWIRARNERALNRAHLRSFSGYHRDLELERDDEDGDEAEAISDLGEGWVTEDRPRAPRRRS